MDINRRVLIEMVGGIAAFTAMSASEKADAAERALAAGLNNPNDSPILKVTGTSLPDPAGVRTIRPGVGRLFGTGKKPVAELAPMPVKPTLVDFFRHRFLTQAQHCLQSANSAMQAGGSEELIIACLLHDVAQELAVVDHGWWGGQLLAPYVSEKVSWAIRYHQALRFFPDESVGYKYPPFYVTLFGKDYVPEPYIKEAYEYAKSHPWYMLSRMITVHDTYSFDTNKLIEIDQFVDIIGRNFRQPAEGLGYDNSPVAHMWRSMIFPDHPL